VPKRKASDVFVECLEAEGVKHVFGIPGEETLDLNESLSRSSIEFIPVRHEQGGAYMADVWGRLTGRAGVCLGTLGPGALNLVTAVADAYLDRAPLVAITGQGDLERITSEMAALTAYMAFTSRGKPMDIKIPNDPRALAAYENGKEYFYTRRGQLNFSGSGNVSLTGGLFANKVSPSGSNWNLKSLDEARGFPRVRILK
jgi:hypothetical protein